MALESTLSGRTHAKLLKEAKEADFEIQLHFLSIPSAKVSRERANNRIKHGGHDGPTKDIKRRYPKVARNLVPLYLPIVDHGKIVHKKP